MLQVLLTLGCVMTSCHTNNVSDDQSSEFRTESIKIEPRKYNIGTISKNTKPIVDFKFSISNLCNDTLYITKITPACDCVEIYNAPNLLLPNAIDTIRGIVHLSHQIGHLNKVIYIECNNKTGLARIVGDVEE